MSWHARQQSPEGLTQWERAERAALRREYIDAVLGNLQGQLDHTYIVDETGQQAQAEKEGGVSRGSQGKKAQQ